MCDSDFTNRDFEKLKAGFTAPAYEGSTDDRLDAAARYIERWTQLEAEIKAQQDELKEKRAQLAKRQEWIEGYVASLITPGENYATQRHQFTWRASKAVEITGQVPPQYMREKIILEPNKVLIGEDLKAGVELEFAALVEKQNLTVK